MNLETNKSLKSFNTFGIDVKTKHFVEVAKSEDVKEVFDQIDFAKNEILILGGGSNILFTKDFDGLTLKNSIKGIQVIDEDEDSYHVRVGAGEVWHDFVMHCVENNWGGVENLSLIPGLVGASPMQNIGAYGVEVKNTVTKVEFLHLEDLSLQELSNDQCEFAYRSSIFKTKLKNQIFISHVHFKLSKEPEFNTSYGAIEDELNRMSAEKSLSNISQAVINIRQSKLPDPKQIGNAGSFFKNPVISTNLVQKLLEEHPEMPVYPAGDNLSKVAAGWLIEKSGWKGKRIEDYGVHAKQALVLVNYGGAHGSQINQLAEDIKSDVHNKFGIVLEKEVNIL